MLRLARGVVELDALDGGRIRRAGRIEIVECEEGSCEQRWSARGSVHEANAELHKRDVMEWWPGVVHPRAARCEEIDGGECSGEHSKLGCLRQTILHRIPRAVRRFVAHDHVQVGMHVGDVDLGRARRHRRRVATRPTHAPEVGMCHDRRLERKLGECTARLALSRHGRFYLPSQSERPLSSSIITQDGRKCGVHASFCHFACKRSIVLYNYSCCGV